MASVYRNFILLDGTENMKPREGMALIVVAGKIIKVCEATDVDLNGINSIDLGGRYLVPGLINMHVHIPGSGVPKKKQTDNKKLSQLLRKTKALGFIGRSMGLKYSKLELFSGVTTIRAVGGVGTFDTEVRDLINNNKADGPRILAANMAVGVENGHMDGTVALGCKNTDEVVKMVESLKNEGVDLIKLMITGGVLDATVKGEPGVLKMPPEFVKAACDKAHELGLQVAAHVESPAGVKVALENGVDTIEHGAKIDNDTVFLFKIKKSSLICTLSPAFPLAKFDRKIMNSTELTQFNSEVVLDGIVQAAKKCIENGIRVGLGTDTGCPYITHYDMWRELDYFVKLCGVTPEFALHTATLKNAEIAGIAQETGSIEEGKSADFVVLDKNPLEDFRNFVDPYMVVMRGKEFLRPKIKRSQEVETRLDEYMPK